VLGEWRHANQMHIVTEIDLHTGALFARNAYGHECANRVVFAQTSERERSVSGSRTEFIGRNGAVANPASMRRKGLSGRTGAGLDPCAAIQARIELGAGQEHEIVFVFGAASNADEARHLVQQYGGQAGARQALEAVWEYWNHTLGAVNVDTPDMALNVVGQWLAGLPDSVVQAVGGAAGTTSRAVPTVSATSCRTPWRSSTQRHGLPASSWFGTRVASSSKATCSTGGTHPTDTGRTHPFCDDYLWLPYATCRYVRATGDTGVLDESIHFLEGRELYVEEEAYYDQPQRSPEAASLYEHCVRALKYGLSFGPHHLPLMGCGDWNDGMNLVGKDGRPRRERVAGLVPGRESRTVCRPGTRPQ